MKKQVILVLSLLLAFAAVSVIFATDKDQHQKKSDAVEANVWTTADGAKHFVCPVTKNEGIVEANTSFSVVDGKKYYHCCSGCAPKFQAEPEKYLKDFVVPGNVIKVDNKKGKIFQCPVSGEEKVVDKNTAFSDVNGKRYYFCCDKCKSKFDKNPEAFLKKAEPKISK